MKNETTITEGLQIDDLFCEKVDMIISRNLNEKNLISEVIIASANEIREESFGECNVELSEYEKKLFFSGFVLGIRKVENDMNNAKNEMLGGIFEKLLKDFGLDNENKE
jgi:hypothetical protein